MVPPTRRRLLHGATALLVGLAGCQGSSSSSSSSNDPSRAENVETDPDSYALRNPNDAPVAWIASSETDDAPPTPRREGAIAEEEQGLIAGDETAGRLRFAGVDGVEDARAFVDATDFDRETLLLDPRKVRECYRLELCAVTWSSSNYHTYYGRTYRPADVACRTEVYDRATRLVRIPDVLDPDAVHQYGSGTSSGSCYKFRHHHRRRVGEQVTTGDGPSAGAASGAGSESGR